MVKKLRLTKLLDGTLGLSQAEIDRIQRAIANEVCGAERPLSGEGVSEQSVPLQSLEDDVELLRLAHDTAIREKLAEPILRAVA